MLFNNFFSALDTSDKVDVIRDLITKRLPDANYKLLHYLVEFLELVSQNVDVNKMNIKSISIIFGPNLLWSPSNGTYEASMKTIECAINLVELLIRFRSEIFTRKLDC
jgi:hypothetical protein